MDKQLESLSSDILAEAFRLSGLNAKLLTALINLADDVKGMALNTYSTAEGDFYEAWKSEDPEGFQYWEAAQQAIAEAEGRS